ncbi:MAG: hypothetical protein WC554_11465 [Clostridia bacterium]
MKIKDIKKEMLNWSDFYGQEIVATDMILKAKTKSDLKDVLLGHISFLEDQHITMMVVTGMKMKYMT